MAANYNVGSPDFTTLQELLNEDGSVSCKPSESLMMGLECKRGNDPLETLYVCGPAVPEGSDVRFCLPARVYVATSGINLAATQNLGELWVTYHLWFEKPTEMGNVGAFAPPPPTVFVPYLSSVGDSFSPVVIVGVSNYPLASSDPGWTVALNTGDTTGLTIPLGVGALGEWTTPLLTGAPAGIAYSLVAFYFFSGGNTTTADATVSVSECTVNKHEYLALAYAGGTLTVTSCIVTPFTPNVQCTFLPAITQSPAVVNGTYSNLFRYSQTFAGSQPESPMAELMKRLAEVDLLRARLAPFYSVRDAVKEEYKSRGEMLAARRRAAEDSLLPRGVEERFRRILANVPEDTTKPKASELGVRYPVGVVIEPVDPRTTLSQEDFDVVSLEGGGVGLKKSDARLALERAAWERRLQRGEGLAWRVDGDSKSPAS